MAIHLALRLGPWGFDDVRGYLANPARLVSLLFELAVTLIAPFFMPRRGLSKGRADRLIRERLPLAGLALLMFLPFVVAPWCDRRHVLTLSGEAWRYAGVALEAFGCWLSVWPPYHMGRNFSGYVTLQEGHQLVTDGPFAWVRHPRYLGIISQSLGYSLVHLAGLGMLATALLAAALVVRLQLEDRLLHAEFGRQWEDYARRTPRLLPGIW
jgi:protein-S-isoprenylcysteine O-methyltransferase Ste14